MLNMENKKFGNLNITKKTSATHADIQSNMIVKKGGRPKKKETQKLTAVISIMPLKVKTNISKY